MRKLEIEIPDNKEIDWAESAKQEKIVFKDQQLTYEDVCKKLFKTGYCYIDTDGRTKADGQNEKFLDEPTNATTRYQLECILAKNKLANVARYLNGEWCTVDFEGGSKWVIFINAQLNDIGIRETKLFSEQVNVIFKSKELAHKAIEILGKETIKLALEPLY